MALEVGIVGLPSSGKTTLFRALTRAAAERYVPSLVLAGGRARTTAEIPLLADRPAPGGRATAYVCRNYNCDAPVTDAAALGTRLDEASTAAIGP